jgi:hypothetical protein
MAALLGVALHEAKIEPVGFWQVKSKYGSERLSLVHDFHRAIAFFATEYEAQAAPFIVDQKTGNG